MERCPIPQAAGSTNPRARNRVTTTAMKWSGRLPCLADRAVRKGEKRAMVEGVKSADSAVTSLFLGDGCYGRCNTGGLGRVTE